MVVRGELKVSRGAVLGSHEFTVIPPTLAGWRHFLELAPASGLKFGELGFRNEMGLLVLTVPLHAGKWVEQRLGDAIVRGPENGLSLDRTARVVNYWTMTRSDGMGTWDRTILVITMG